MDIVGVGRVERLVTENAGIVDVLFTERERDYCLGKRRAHEHMAGRFAAKEAVQKASLDIFSNLTGRPASSN